MRRRPRASLGGGSFPHRLCPCGPSSGGGRRRPRHAPTAKRANSGEARHEHDPGRGLGDRSADRTDDDRDLDGTAGGFELRGSARFLHVEEALDHWRAGGELVDIEREIIVRLARIDKAGARNEAAEEKFVLRRVVSESAGVEPSAMARLWSTTPAVSLR